MWVKYIPKAIISSYQEIGQTMGPRTQSEHKIMIVWPSFFQFSDLFISSGLDLDIYDVPHVDLYALFFNSAYSFWRLHITIVILSAVFVLWTCYLDFIWRLHITMYKSEMTMIKFSGKNYSSCAYQLELYLKGKELGEHISGSKSKPTDEDQIEK